MQIKHVFITKTLLDFPQRLVLKQRSNSDNGRFLVFVSLYLQGPSSLSFKAAYNYLRSILVQDQPCLRLSSSASTWCEVITPKTSWFCIPYIYLIIFENIFPGKTRKPWFMLLYLAELIIVIVYCMVCLTATQRVQNAAARLIFEESKYCHVTPLLKSLHTGCPSNVESFLKCF